MTEEHESQAGRPHDRLLPFHAAIGMVGFSRAKVYQLLDQGLFPRPVKVGRNNYFSERELQAWVRRRLDERAVKA